MQTESGVVLSHNQQAPGVYLLTLRSPRIVSEAKPGQFVQLLVSPQSYEPLLRRPFCFYKIDRKNDALGILYQVVGKGTELLAQAPVGATLDVLGPLGNGFTITPDLQDAVLIGGGLGLAPLYELADVLYAKNVNTDFFLGTKNRPFLCLNLTGKHVCTEDGSAGYQGLATDLMRDKIKAGEIAPTATIFACGPPPMLKVVQKIAAEFDMRGQMSLEAKMACGFGVCLGCAVKKAKADGYYKVCKDGPVFNLDEVVL